MSKRPITVKNPIDKDDKIGINLNDFDYRSVQFFKIGENKTMSKVAFKVIASEAGVLEEEANIDCLKKYALNIGLPYSEAFRKMLISYLKKKLSDRRFDLKFIHKRVFGKDELGLFEGFLDHINDDDKIKGMDIVKKHYLDGWSLRKIAIKKNKSAEYIRMSKEEALRQIRIATVKRDIRSVFDAESVRSFNGV